MNYLELKIAILWIIAYLVSYHLAKLEYDIKKINGMKLKWKYYLGDTFISCIYLLVLIAGAFIAGIFILQKIICFIQWFLYL